MGEAKVDYAEMKAIVVAFLQQNLKEHRNGFTIQEFERKFPDAADEPRDWYKRYGKKNTLEALECIEDSINIKCDSRYNTVYISLNLASEVVDEHLVDLITNQKQSTKKRSIRPSQRLSQQPTHRARAQRSFSLNKPRSNTEYIKRSTQPNRLNYDQQYKGDQFIRRRSPTPPSVSNSRPPSIYDKSPAKWIATNDPRQSRSSNAGLMVPPQVRLPVPQPAAPRVAPSAATSVQSTPLPRPAQPSSSTQSISGPSGAQKTQLQEPEKKDDPAMVAKKDHFRQRLVSLLMRRSSEIILLHLNGLYQLEFGESINWAEYNYKDLSSLLMDPIVAEVIQINLKQRPTISIRPKIIPSDKENIESNISMTNGHSVPSAKDKINAVDPFNVRPMLQSLEPLGQIKEPPLLNFEIDDIVKYKTMRMILNCENQIMKLDDWEIKFEQENRLRIKIRDFGCRTVLEFFKRLSVDIPIKIETDNEYWVARADLERLDIWLKDKMEKNQFRALTAIDSRYELISFPDDTYTYTDVKDITHSSYQPGHILSVKPMGSMWIQLRTPKRIEDHLCVEATLTCYEDFTKKKIIPTPKNFIRPGFPCAVFDRTLERWCRGLVLKVEKKDDIYEAKTLLVDYGLEKTYAPTQLFCLMKNHLRFPVGSIYSKLHGVHDNSIIVLQRAKMILQEYTNPPVTLACKFLGSSSPSKNPSYLPSVSADVTLVDTRQGKDCNLADDINMPPDSLDIEEGNETPNPCEPVPIFNAVIDQ